MNITVFKTEPIAIKAWTEKRIIYLELTDGRIFGFPVDRFRILSQASENQLKAVQIEVGGYALRWEDMDKRFEQLTSRIDHFMVWSFATTLAVGGIVIATIKFL